MISRWCTCAQGPFVGGCTAVHLHECRRVRMRQMPDARPLKLVQVKRKERMQEASSPESGRGRPSQREEATSTADCGLVWLAPRNESPVSCLVWEKKGVKPSSLPPGPNKPLPFTFKPCTVQRRRAWSYRAAACRIGPLLSPLPHYVRQEASRSRPGRAGHYRQWAHVDPVLHAN